MKTNIVYLILLLLITVSCDKEKVTIKGEMKGCEDCELQVMMNALSDSASIDLGTTAIEDGKLKFKTKNITPPAKISFMKDSVKLFDIWVEKFGNTVFEAENNYGIKINWVDNFLSKEIKRIKESYHEQYIQGIEKHIVLVDSLNKRCLETQDLTDQEMITLDSLELVVKKGKRLYRKNIISTFRATKLNAIAIALVVDEWNLLTSWQRKEVKKSAFKKYPHTGMYWQICH